MSHRQEVKIILQLIKRSLGQKKIRYRQISERLGVSLPTVKRMMSDDDISFDRLCQLCDMIELSIFELMEIAKNEVETPFLFTDEQNEYLANHPYLVAYFFALLKRRMTPDTIEQTYGLSSQSTAYYLRQLETLGLLERLAGNKIRLLAKESGFSAWNDDSPLGKIYVRHILEAMGERVTKHLEHPSDVYFSTGSHLLTATENAELSADWNRVMDTYSKRTLLNRLKNNREAQTVTYMLATDVWRDPFL